MTGSRRRARRRPFRAFVAVVQRRRLRLQQGRDGVAQQQRPQLVGLVAGTLRSTTGPATTVVKVPSSSASMWPSSRPTAARTATGAAGPVSTCGVRGQPGEAGLVDHVAQDPGQVGGGVAGAGDEQVLRVVGARPTDRSPRIRSGRRAKNSLAWVVSPSGTSISWLVPAPFRLLAVGFTAAQDQQVGDARCRRRLMRPRSAAVRRPPGRARAAISRRAAGFAASMV